MLKAIGPAMNWKHDLLVVAYQRACQHYHRAAKLYWALADQEHDPKHRVLLRWLSKRALRQKHAYANVLTLLHLPVPTEPESWSDQAWRWLLVCSGTQTVFMWLKWDELSHALLFELLAKTRSPKKKENL